MEINVITDIEELSLYRNQWKNILMLNNNNNPYIEMDFIIRWWEFLGKGHKQFILHLKNDNKTIGFFPLMITKKLLYNEVNFIGYPEAIYMDVVISNQYIEEGIKYIFDYLLNLKGNFLFKLHGMIEKSSSFKGIEKYLKKNKMSYFSRISDAYLIKISNRNFQDYFKERAKNHRPIKKIKNNEKKLKALGNLTYGRLEEERIDEIFNLHNKRWEKKNDTSNFGKGKTRDFFKHLALDKNLTFKVHVDALKLKGKVIAFKYGFLCNDKYICYRITHDDDFSRYSLGRIIDMKKIEECFNNNTINVVDWSTGDGKEKTKWTNDIEPIVKCLIFERGNFISKLIFSKKVLIEKIIHFLKKNDKVIRFKRNTLGKIRYYVSKKFYLLIYKRIKNEINNRGLIKAILKSLIWLLNRVYLVEEFKIFERNDTTVFQWKDSKYLVERAKIEDLYELSQIMNTEPVNVVDRFYKKHHCYIAKYNNEIVGYVWIASKFNDILEEYKLSDSGLRYPTFYLYDYFLKRGFKYKGIYGNIVQYMVNDLSQKLNNQNYVIIVKKNKRIMEILKLFKFKEKDSIKRIMLFGVYKHTSSQGG